MTDLVIASNRGPPPDRRATDHNPGAGGLLTGLTRALKNEAGTWVSVVDAKREVANGVDKLAGSSVRLDRVSVDSDQFDAYYSRVSNSVLWPLHVGVLDLLEDVAFNTSARGGWEAYRAVNRRVAASCMQWTGPSGHVLVQDYHLSLVPAMVRTARSDLGIAHFTHCPWADPADFAMLPTPIAGELIAGMLGADLLGFYAPRWARDFLQTCAKVGYTISQKDGAVRSLDGRWIRVQAYPLGVDQRELRREATCRQAMRHRRALEELASGRRLIVRVERMDPVKNLLRGLDAFASFLNDNPWALGQVVHFVLACASRRGIPVYRTYRNKVAARVRAINSRFGSSTWCPVVLVERPDYFLGLAALSLADVVVINSVRDGMNIVAKEAATVNERDAVLILSRTAGAADELGDGALLVDPLSTPQLVAAIGAALAMPHSERRERANLLQRAATALPPRAWLAAQRRDLTEMLARR